MTGDLLACHDCAKCWSSKVHLLPGCFRVVEVSETVVEDLAVLACERLTSVQELDKWVFLKPQESVNVTEIVDVNVDEATFVEKLLPESPRFYDSFTTSHVDALAS